MFPLSLTTGWWPTSLKSQVARDAWMQGSIFDIQTSALHDGPGIRTTVFLKGCPLRCTWCSNPESFSLESTLSWKQESCVDCLSCTKVCESGSLTAPKGKLVVQQKLCTGCGKCLEVCPEDALKLFGYRERADEIIRLVARDKAYFYNSGGGITLSGGEAMMQADFCLDLLKESKKQGLHTCMETSGYARQEEFSRMLPHTDLFLFDYKATGVSKHRDLTGQSNELILENLEYLNRCGAKIILRCPLIPGVNDTQEHLQAITRISAKLEQIIEVELLPYHNYGEHKYEQTGRSAPCKGIAAVKPDKVKQWEKTLDSMGCKKLKKSI